MSGLLDMYGALVTQKLRALSKQNIIQKNTRDMTQLGWSLGDCVALSSRDGTVSPPLTQDRAIHWMLSLPPDLLSTLLSGSVTQKMEGWVCGSIVCLPHICEAPDLGGI